MTDRPPPEEAGGEKTAIGFLINPIAGMGGRIGLKGTDGVVDRAIALGAEAIATTKAARCLEQFVALTKYRPEARSIVWRTCSGEMGEEALRAAGIAIDRIDIVHDVGPPTGSADTLTAVERFVRSGVRLILFCGGDGTARDIAGVVGTRTPMLGIPSGVKMFSGVFGTSPERTAEILAAFLAGEIAPVEVEVLDLDEEAYRQGRWAVRLFHAVTTPFEPTLTQQSKMLIGAASDPEVKADIAAHLREFVAAKSARLLLLGPGSTVNAIKTAYGIEGTMLGIDAVADGAQVGADLNERGIIGLLDRYPDRRLILSPIGAQGFVLGRGNLQISPEVIRRIGREAIVVVATPAKLAQTPVLRFDTGDPSLDRMLLAEGYINVVTGYGMSSIVKVAI